MPDGMTCGTCLTLNPPGAPACVRCNTPLAADAGPGADPAAVPDVGPPLGPDPLQGSKRIGPGLAAAPTAAPGSSRAQAAPEQPPGYGVAEPPPAPAPPPEDPSIARRVTIAGLVAVALVLVVGGTALWLLRPRYVDISSVQQTIGADLSGRGRGSVTVSCPSQVRSENGAQFACIATDMTGGKRTVTVTLVDSSGKYTWALGTA